MIAVGFVLYEGLYTVLLGLLGHYGAVAATYVSALDAAAYAATVGIWLNAAWRIEWGDLPLKAQRHLAGR
jgi:hypothetical protein